MKIIIIFLALFAVSCEDDGVSPNYGCTITGSQNYNPNAIIDDGYCYYPGCTDPNAINFNPDATDDDESCIISENTSSLTYESYFRNVLNQYCFGCHGFLNLDRNNFLTTGWVELGNPNSSSLYNRINLEESNPLSMPQGQSNLGEDLINKIESWIEDDCP